MPSDFPRLSTVIDEGIKRKLHTGVQAYASIDGEVVLDEGFGEARVGSSMASSTIMLWRSAGKPLTAVAILQLVETGQLSLTTKVCELLPNCADTPAGEATIAELLTHTSAIPLTATGWPQRSTHEILASTFESMGGLATPTSAYQPQITWFLLGEILRTLTGTESYSDAIRQQLLNPLSIDDVWCGIPPSNVASILDRLPTIYERTKGQLVESDYSAGEWLTQPSPGGNFRGPIRQLGRFYEMLANKGVTSDGVRILKEETVMLMTERHRSDQFDQTLHHTVDYGLGMITDSNHHGETTVPYGFGRHSSPNSFGHGGAQCSIGFCDPANKLVVAWAANGFCGEGQHQRRNRAINEAIYGDLRISKPTTV